MLRFVLVLTCAGLSSCASVLFPQSPQEMLSSSTRSQDYCYPDSPAVVTERVKSYLESCYTPRTSTMMIPAAGVMVAAPRKMDWRVVSEPSGEGTQLSVALQHGFVLSAVIKPASGSCASGMRVYGGTPFWEDRFPHIDAAARGGQAVCKAL